MILTIDPNKPNGTSEGSGFFQTPKGTSSNLGPALGSSTHPCLRTGVAHPQAGHRAGVALALWLPGRFLSVVYGLVALVLYIVLYMAGILYYMILHYMELLRYYILIMVLGYPLYGTHYCLLIVETPTQWGWYIDLCLYPP